MRASIRYLACVFLAIGVAFAFCGKVHCETIDGYPIEGVSADRLEAFLEYHQWEELPADTAMSGQISGFAADGSRVCAIQLRDKIYLIRDGVCVACYRYHTEGSNKLLFHNGALVIYEVRGDMLLFVDPETGGLTLYEVKEEKADLRLQAQFYRFGDLQSDATVNGNGYYVTNHIPQTDGSFNSYDKLIWSNDGREMVVYASSARLVWSVVAGAGCVAAALIVLFYFRARKVRQRENSA